MWTKGELVEQAFIEIGLSPNVFNVSPDKLDSGLRMLDSMMGTWYAKGIHIGYALSTTAEGSELGQDSGLPLTAVEAVYLNLAVRLAPSFGKQVSPDTKVNARQGFDAMATAAAQPQRMHSPANMPRGAGNKTWRYARGPFTGTPIDSITVTPEGADIDL